eukprot:1764317-Amphidinium_carterae.1
MLPSAGRGWSSCAEKVKHVMKDKDYITCTLALPMLPGKILASLVFKGRAKQSLPSIDLPDGLSVGLSDTHWQTTEILLDFIKAIDSSLNPGFQHA